MQCFRTDLNAGDEVIVRRADGKLSNANITELRYLNWECSGRIECRKAESAVDSENNILLPKGSPLVYGLSTPEVFIRALREIGWVPVKSKQRMYKAILANLNETHVAYILVRKNGLDIRMFFRSENDELIPYSLYERSSSDSKQVRHALAHTTFNLYEGILRFSNSFLNNESDLNRYFVPQGSTDKRTEELKERSKHRKDREEDSGIGDVGDYPDDMYLGYHMK